MTTTPATTAFTPTEQKQPDPKQDGDPKFNKALANAGFEIPTDQLAQMGVAVMSPMFMSQVQDIISDALGED